MRSVGPGTVIGSRYEVLSPVGTGGMGVVFKAHDRSLDETVAVKVLRSYDPGESQIVRFRSEVKLARRVRHRNVCAIHDYGEDGELFYISMELIEGRDLRSILEEEGALEWETAYDVALQVAEGLTAIHEAGIIHRDLKPANIMIDARGRVRVMDFGIAKIGTAEMAALTQTGQIVGSPRYMSPEQVRGRRLDARSDLYSFALVIFEAFSGRPAFLADRPVEAMLMHLDAPPPVEGSASAHLPPALVPVLGRALAKEPDDRYSSCRQMQAALKAALAALRTDGTEDWSLPPPSRGAPASRAKGATPSASPTDALLLVPMLVRALGHADPTVRAEAARALGRTPHPSAASALRAALEDLSPEVRGFASEALNALGPEVRVELPRPARLESAESEPPKDETPPAPPAPVSKLPKLAGPVPAAARRHPDAVETAATPVALIPPETIDEWAESRPHGRRAGAAPSPARISAAWRKRYWLVGAGLVGIGGALWSPALLRGRAAVAPPRPPPASVAPSTAPPPPTITVPPEPLPLPTASAASSDPAGVDTPGVPSTRPREPKRTSPPIRATPLSRPSEPAPSIVPRGAISEPTPPLAAPSALPSLENEPSPVPPSLSSAPLIEIPKVAPGSLVRLDDPDVVGPVCEVCARPALPAIAQHPTVMAKLRRNNIVRLRILVDERGQVADTQALDKVELLTDASMKAVRRWHYRAATKVGVPVRVWIDVRIVFELPGS